MRIVASLQVHLVLVLKIPFHHQPINRSTDQPGLHVSQHIFVSFTSIGLTHDQLPSLPFNKPDDLSTRTKFQGCLRVH